jgi:hypothetical protein
MRILLSTPKIIPRKTLGAFGVILVLFVPVSAMAQWLHLRYVDHIHVSLWSIIWIVRSVEAYLLEKWLIREIVALDVLFG